MKPEMTDWARLTETLGELRSELKRLGERVAALETAALTKPAFAASPARAASGPLAAETAAHARRS